jgi:translation initiation factor IF-2
VRDEFEALLRKRMLELNELGLNCALAWENTDLATTVSLVPTSASTGDGIPDLLFHILDFSQSLLLDKLKLRDELECSVMEVRSMDRLGTTIDVLLKNGTLQEGERIMVAGLNGPIVTTIKSLLTPESTRGKEKYTSHASISTSCSVRICAQGLDQAVAGTELRKVAMGQMPTEQQLEELRHNVHSGASTLLNEFKKDSTGIFVKASEAGKLEALLQLLKPIGVPVFEVGLGDVQQKDVRRAAVMKEKRCPEFAVIIAFDVKASPDAKTQALRDGVQLITSANIFELQSQLEQRYAPLQEKDGADDKNLIFPVMLHISRIYRDVLPLTFACAVVDGQLQLGTPLCIPGSQLTPVGRVSAIFRDSECLTTAQCGDRVRVTIEQTEAEKQAIASAHFGTGDMLYPLMTRSDIDVFKAAFKDELRREDWKLLNDVKQALRIV